MTNRWYACGALLTMVVVGVPLYGQSSPEPSGEKTTPVLSIPSIASHEVRTEIEERNYAGAESLLVGEIRQHAESPELLDLLGGVFFLDGKYLNSAIAFKREEAVKPLSSESRFSLAMAYVVIGHRDWARPEIEKLARESPGEALYPYWLSRLDYDAQLFEQAIAEARVSVKLDPLMARSYDNLGLCYEAIGQWDNAIKEYQTATKLEREKQHPSAWPDVNLATLLVKLGRLDGVENLLKEALQFDPRFPRAHHELGLLFEKQANNREAIKELLAAVELDPSFDEAFYALGRVYQRTGEIQKAQSAYEEFQQLKKEKAEKKENVR